MTHGSPYSRPRRRFGQHFLVRPEIARAIVSLASLDGSQTVLEVGPGRAALSHMLAGASKDLWLVEVDRDLCRHLREVFASQRHVHVVEGDILALDLDRLLPASSPAVVVANLPYNISTPVLMKLLDRPERFSRLVLMLQREVAERIMASPGTKAYGALSVIVRLVASVHTGFPVPPSAFSPRPKVDSLVVVVEPRMPPALASDELKTVRSVVRAAFSQRRKQLGNALAPLIPAPREVLDRLAIDPRRRPETLAPEEFVAVARAVAAQR